MSFITPLPPTFNQKPTVLAPSNRYVPPKDLYSFPPNTQTVYLPPTEMHAESSVTSYLPPPSGQIEYHGPVYPEYMHDPHDHSHDPHDHSQDSHDHGIIVFFMKRNIEIELFYVC